MRLYIMRHGPATDSAATGRDFDRELTTSGRERVKHVVEKLTLGEETPRVVFSSPLVRAQQTAEIVTDQVTSLRGQAIEITDALSPGADPDVLVSKLIADGTKRAILVGHEPDLSGLVQNLLARPFLYDMRKAMVVGIHFDSGSRATLRFILDPTSLEWLHDARA